MEENQPQGGHMCQSQPSGPRGDCQYSSVNLFFSLKYFGDDSLKPQECPTSIKFYSPHLVLTG